MKRWVVIIAAAWAVCGLTWWVLERLLVSEEKRVVRQVEALRRAAESGKTLALADGIAQDYTDDYGFDKRGLIGALAEMRREYPNLEFRIERLTVRVTSDRADASVRGRAVSGMEVVESGDFRLTFSKRAGAWKLKAIASERKEK